MAFCSFQDDVSLPFASHRVLCGGVTYHLQAGHLGSSSSSAFSHSSSSHFSSALFGFLLLMVFPPTCYKTLVLRTPYITLSILRLPKKHLYK